jgi:hypothetical protein
MREKVDCTAQIKRNGFDLSLRADYCRMKIDISDQVYDSRFRFRKAMLIGTNFKPKIVRSVVMDNDNSDNSKQYASAGPVSISATN